MYRAVKKIFELFLILTLLIDMNNAPSSNRLKSIFISISFFLTMSFLLFLQCKNKESNDGDTTASRIASEDHEVGGIQSGQAQDQAPAPMAEPGQAAGRDAYGRRGLSDGTAAGVFLAQPDAKGRLLEYIVTLNYSYKDFSQSRKLLLNIASRYGFVKSANSYLNEDSPSMTTEIHVRSESIYEVLTELDALGELTSENITVQDHTENSIWQARKLRREQIRGARRSQAMAVDPAARTYQERENSLAQSEDSQDLAEQEQWKIRDRVAFAKITVQLQGPEAPAKIEVPVYRNAWVGFLNFLLKLVYVLIYILPFPIIGGLTVYAILKVAKLLKKKKA